ncbi:hypothetical protein BAUCODRAFT_575837 [Baudoinia panamericana UAMH 10762]|uniref:Fe2OG dioxygenase domain-containing protein n=1 Tax=Baudoinia panamericana (strain UAMH 10762) TaxID=717646 RepID=M2MHQ8_BAUPA|nr:uncharacterized protein BAUCODRAFT_575837 [Baudoinia panamericana UAMH 10762]EMC96151.1 hypothetical protein BAUCODRAFT_575837 [Baudoinia panamericana UAMH 10762]
MAVKEDQAAPPVLDFSSFWSGDSEKRAALINALRKACEDKGFFQLVNHGISDSLQRSIIQASKDFFALPLEEKLKCDGAKSKPSRRGYEVLGAQMLEPGSKPEHKESFYVGEDLPADHPRILRGDYNCSPNIYPEVLGEQWKAVTAQYYREVVALGMDVMRSLALGLGLPESWFDDFMTEPSCTLRLLHYPPTPRGCDKERGVGAHRDFGCITLLLQDSVGGLQVQDETTGRWHDVTPIPGALVVNLGNLMMRWSNHHYTSNTHRVLNFAEQDRTSIVLFFNGNPEHILGVLPGCEQHRQNQHKKYGPPMEVVVEPVKVREFLNQQYLASYNRVQEYKV